MHLKKLWKLFEEEIFTLESNDTLWNPYKGHNHELDQPEGYKVRRRNLKSYLEEFSLNPEFLLIGEAPGPWGCRFSGLAFTSERQLSDGSLPFSGNTSSTFDPPVIERSGSVLWGTLASYHPRFFVWNSIPLHPINSGEPLSIRTPKKSELVEYSPILIRMIEILKPKSIIAIGRKSETAAVIIAQSDFLKYLRAALFISRAVLTVINCTPLGGLRAVGPLTSITLCPLFLAAFASS